MTKSLHGHYRGLGERTIDEVGLQTLPKTVVGYSMHCGLLIGRMFTCNIFWHDDENLVQLEVYFCKCVA